LSTVQDIINRVQTELEDATGTSGTDWTDADYILGKLATLSDDIAIRLELLDLNYNTQETILGNIPANTTDLSVYQAFGQVLAQMLIPKSVEWRLVGENQQQWEMVQQVDKIIDTDTGTGLEATPAINTTAESDVFSPIGVIQLAVLSIAGMFIGQELTVDVGAAQEVVEVVGLNGSIPAFSAVFTKVHTHPFPVVAPATSGVTSDDPTVESYEWRGGILKISPCLEPVDLRVRFVATVISLSTNSQQQIIGLTNVYVYKCCEKICASRAVGTSALVEYFAKCYERACADFEGLSIKTQQSKTIRLGGRRSNCGSGWSSGGFTPPIVG
jgi:hypothetical protein